MRYNLYLSYVLLFTISIFGIDAQTVKTDSLKNLLQIRSKKDSTRVNLLNETANAFQNINPETSKKYITEAYNISIALNYSKGKAEAFYQMANYYNTISDFEKVLEYAQKSQTIFEDISDKKGMAKNMLAIGDIYYFQGDVVKALDFKKKALDINIELKDSLAICHSYANIGTDYCDIGNFALALDYEKKALDIAYNLTNKKSISYALNNLGVVYNVQGNFPKALECYQKSFWIDEKQKNYKDAAVSASNIAFILNIQGEFSKAIEYCQKGLDYSEQIGFKTGLTYNYEYLGLIYKNKGDYEKAWENHQKALTLQKEIGNKTGLANAYKDLAEIYYLQKMYSEAISYYNQSLNIGKAIANMQIEMKCYVGLSVLYANQKKYLLAQKYGNKAFSMANDIGNIDLIKQSAEILAQSKAALGEYKEAYKFFVLFKNMSDSLYNEENIKSMANLEYQYKYQKEREAMEFEQQKKDAIHTEQEKQQKIIRDSLIGGIILAIVLALAVLHNLLQKRKANLILAKQKKRIEEVNKKLTIQKEEIQAVAQELEKANKTKDKFFSIIAHDLKSPFGGILGFTELLLENHAMYKDEERETYIQYINDCSLKTYKLLENLLTWAQSQTGIIKFSPEKINIKTLINEIITLLKETAENKEIKLGLKSEKEILVIADKNMIYTIILNLVSNAIKFTPKGGDIIIKSHVITNKNKQQLAQISVEDTGIGISPKIQPQLFDINENTSTKGTENETGTGLGLILCKEFIEKHNGNIWAESKTDIGSKFLFTIPLSKKYYNVQK
ncbi:tetratricopeptide repeat-containing sensor histidine kinase [Saccharicrinis sp. GN24d3]|uniref:tetratricopeptide repeat-containing sensor histidine kinase n=1 Tax=Saccharicrinis sp. GN24d3 TaxID=3458416 RepID=UPI004035A44A